MDWSGFDMDRLYFLYTQHFHQLRADVIQVNRSLGSSRPEMSWLELLSRTDFERLVSTPADEPEVVQRWVRCVIRGHEHEFPEVRVA